MSRPNSLAGRVFIAQLVVLTITFVALLATILLVAPGLFMYHLEMTGEDSPLVQLHAQQAFGTAVGIALLAAAAVAVLAAVLLSWFVARRVSRPIEDLADAAVQVAAGGRQITVPDNGFSRELADLSVAFQEMAEDLASTDQARARLLTDLAHEIRTPLATLEAHIDGLEDGILAADPHTFEVMRGQVKRLQRLSGDVRLAAAAQEHALDLQLRQVQISDVVSAACQVAGPSYLEKGVELHGPCENQVTVRVDTDRIAQVLSNLLDNALRHTPTGGQVTISCDVDAREVRVLVADTGEGIPADQLTAVFERFHRVDGSRRSESGGSGLGLTIARAIAVDHGGSLTATSPGVGGGTTMMLALPR